MESATTGDCGEMVKDLSAGSAYDITEDSEGLVLGQVKDKCPVHWSEKDKTLSQVPAVASCATPVGKEGLELKVTRRNASCTLVTAQRLECAFDLGAIVSLKGTEAKRCDAHQRIVVVRKSPEKA